MLVLPNPSGGGLSTADDYPEQGFGVSLGPSHYATALVLSFYNANVAFKLIYPSDPKRGIAGGWVYSPEITRSPNALVFAGAYGFAARSAAPGKPAQVLAELWETIDGPPPTAAAPITSTLSSSGLVGAVGVLDTQLAAANIPVAVNTEANPTTIFTFQAVTFDGVTAVKIELAFPDASFAAAAAGNEFGLNLWDGSSDLGRIAHVKPGTTTFIGPLHPWTRITPPAASVAYRIRAWALTQNVTLVAGGGGPGAPLNGVARIVTP